MSTEEANNPDLRDRAYIYWRLISGDKELAKQVVLCDKPLISSEDTSINDKLRDKLTRNLGHISSLLLQDPDTLIFNNEYELIADDDDQVNEDD
jgi:AP-1 complex subunit beta-1